MSLQWQACFLVCVACGLLVVSSRVSSSCFTKQHTHSQGGSGDSRHIALSESCRAFSCRDATEGGVKIWGVRLDSNDRSSARPDYHCEAELKIIETTILKLEKNSLLYILMVDLVKLYPYAINAPT